MTAEPYKVTLDKLIIHDFRHVAPGTALDFDKNINVILGQNGTGKTTLLKLISVVSRLDLRGLTKEAFDLEWVLTLGSASLNVRATNTKHNREHGGATTGSQNAYSLAYHLVLQGPEVSSVSIQWGEMLAVLVDGSPFDQRMPTPTYDIGEPLRYILNILTIGAQSSVYSTLVVHLLFLKNAYRFDEGLELAKDLGIATSSNPNNSILSAKPSFQLFKGPDSVIYLENEFFPASASDYLLNRYVTPDHTSFSETPKRVIELSPEDVPFLRDAADAMGFRECQMTLTLLDGKQGTDNPHFTFGFPAFHFTKIDGSACFQDRLSFGQLRMLTLAYYLDASPQIAIADELSNGFHYNLLQDCLEFCKGHQLFVTSQNPLLLDRLEFDSIDEVQRRFITCHSAISEEEPEMVFWSNIDRSDAADLFGALDVGFQGVSEILRSLDLW